MYFGGQSSEGQFYGERGGIFPVTFIKLQIYNAFRIWQNQSGMKHGMGFASRSLKLDISLKYALSDYQKCNWNRKGWTINLLPKNVYAFNVLLTNILSSTLPTTLQDHVPTPPSLNWHIFSLTSWYYFILLYTIYNMYYILYIYRYRYIVYKES